LKQIYLRALAKSANGSLCSWIKAWTRHHTQQSHDLPDNVV
jgi:hypothetical protein